MTTPTAYDVAGHSTPPHQGRRGAVRANGQLIIHHLVSTDPDVLAGAHRAAERTGSDDVTAFVTSALGVGAKALAVADTNLDLAELDRSVQAFTGQVFQVTSAALGPRRAGHRPGRRHRRPRARHRR